MTDVPYRFLFGLIAILLNIFAANAQPITLTATGHFTSKNDLCGGFCDLNGIGVGTPFTLAVTYDLSTPLLQENFGNGVLGAAGTSPIPPNSFVLSAGSSVFSADQSSFESGLSVSVGTVASGTFQGDSSFSIGFSGNSTGVKFSRGGSGLIDIFLGLIAPPGVFSSTTGTQKLPSTFPPLPQYLFAGVQLETTTPFGGTALFLNGVLDTLAAPSGCDPLPDGVENLADGWAGSSLSLLYTVGTFNIGLAGQGDFSGRTMKEVDAGGSSDYCYFPGATVGPIVLGGSSWGVLSGNALNPPLDQFGLGEDQVDAYRRQRTANGLPLPCQVILHQQMTMSCPDGTFRAFGPVNRLIYTVNQFSVSVQRDGVNGTGAYESKRYVTQ